MTKQDEQQPQPNGIDVADLQWALGQAAWAELLGRIELKKEIEKRDAIIAQLSKRASSEK